MWITSKEIKKILHLSNQALYERRKADKILHKLISGVRFYWLDENPYQNIIDNKLNVIYCRVSNTKQKLDLDRQETILKEYVVSNGYKVDLIFKDIASGMNEDRIEFNKLIDLVLEKKVNKVFISYKDRLTRFGFGYFETMFEKLGTKIEVVNLTNEEDFQTELITDLISIIHHFSMKMNSNRRKQLNRLKTELEQDSDSE